MTNKPKFLLIYGSQTGQAEAIAEEIRDNASSHGMEADFHCMDKTEKKFNLDRTSCAVIVVSTTGEGDAPDNAQKLWRRIKKRTLQSDHLSKLNYALLGLGDSNYVSFCMCGKNFSRRLQELGAKSFYNCGWGDDAVGLEATVEPWIQGLWPALREFLGLEPEINDSIVNEPSNVKNDRQINGHSDEEKIQRDSSENEIKMRTVGDSVYKKTDKEDDHNVGPDGDGVASVKDKVATTKADTDAVPIIPSSSQITNTKDATQISTSSKSGNSDTDRENESKQSEVISDESKRTNDAVVSDEAKDTVDNAIVVPSLTRSVPPLCESGLTLPLLAAAYLQIEYTDEKMNCSSLPIQNSCKLPSAASDVTMVPVTKVTKLTRDDALKTALEYELSLEGTILSYQPGDSFSIICPNQESEVDMLINRLSLEDVCDKTYTISILPGTKKRNASIPSHIHPTATLRHTLLTCCDIREPPKKAYLRMLVEHTDDPVEKRRLQELCSKQGAADYTNYVREPNLSILDILAAFKSCHPPVERLLEHLPRLQPRPYSASSSPLKHSNHLRFVFNMINIPSGDGRALPRRGVCTGWLSSIATQSVEPAEKTTLEDDMKNLRIVDSDVKVPIFLRTNQHFHLPNDPNLPVIMIGPGTGVAPFIGFLSHRQQEALANGTKFGKMWLFYGCRHQERDYLYEDEMRNFKDQGLLTEFSVCFSRDSCQEGPLNQNESDTSSLVNKTAEEVETLAMRPKYVQDNIKLNAEKVLQWICDENAVVYVCGDAKNMARDVNQTLADILTKYRGIEDAKGFLMKLRLKKHYHEDIWT